MKRILVAALCLAACHREPTASERIYNQLVADGYTIEQAQKYASAGQAVPPLPPGGEGLYKLYIDWGESPKEARRRVIAMAEPSLSNQKRAAANAADRQSQIQQVRASACKNDPGLGYC